MIFEKKHIQDVVLIKPKINNDERGYFIETFRQDVFQNLIGYKINFCQDNETKSKKGVLRGLHFQLPPFAQSKLVRVIEGEVLDISVDIRLGSPTFGKHIAEILSGKNKYQLFIPRGFAHGFVVLSDYAILSYKVDNYYSIDCDRGLAFNDPTLGINWILPPNKILLSDKDKNQPLLKNLSEECSKFSFHKSLYGQ